MENLIIKIMDKDHKKIKELLIELERNINNNSSNLEISFDRFKWNLEKHFFIEEKVIFNTNNLSEIDIDLSNILSQHIKILSLIEKIEEELYDEKIPNLYNLKNTLLEHANFEDTVFYPKLDESLTVEEKEEIINRVKDIIID